MSAMLGARLDLAPFLLSPSPSPPSSTLRIRPSLSLAPAASGTRFLAPRAAAAATAVSLQPAAAAPLSADRTAVRLGIASKGRMSDLTRDLLKSCQLTVIQSNPRQYVADIPQMPNLEVWLQRPTVIVRKLCSGDLDLGIVGYDIISEVGHGNDDLVIIHDALDFGHCHLSLAVPKEGIFQNINTLEELVNMPQWTEERPMRVVTGFGYVGAKFLKEKGFKHVSFLAGDGALESYPAMTWYVVYRGRAPGVYDDWEQCRRQVHQFSGNIYKGFTILAEAQARYASYLGREMYDAGERSRKRMKTTFGVMTMLVFTVFLYFLFVV